MNFQDFYAGSAFDAYTWLGGHLTAEGAVFRTFAPAARAGLPDRGFQRLAGDPDAQSL